VLLNYVYATTLLVNEEVVVDDTSITQGGQIFKIPLKIDGLN
jgi:hypothetical protein